MSDKIIFGDSQVEYLFQKQFFRSYTECFKEGRVDNWKFYSHTKGLTIYAAIDQIEKDILNNSIDLSLCKNFFVMFGTNDALRKIENPKSLTEFIPKYIESLKIFKDRYDIDSLYVISPFYMQGFDKYPSTWLIMLDKMNDENTANNKIKELDSILMQEIAKYPDIEYIETISLFQEDGELFHNKYSKDGVHLNELGSKKFLNNLQTIIYNKRSKQ